MNSVSVLPYLWMLIGAFAFAMMGTLTHALRDHFDWQVIALVRATLALVFSTALAVANGTRFVYFRPRTLWIRSIAGSISLICTFFALTRLPVADVLTLTNMFPIWVALLSWPLLGDRPAAEVWVAVLLGVVGVVLIQQPHITAGDFASLVALFSSFSTSIAMLGLHRLQGIDARAIVVHFSAVSILFCIASFFLFENGPPDYHQPDLSKVLLLLGVGVSATVGQFMLTKAFAAGPPAKVSVVALTQVGFAMLLDIAIWGRTFSPISLLGISLVVAPTAWILLRRRPAVAVAPAGVDE